MIYTRLTNGFGNNLFQCIASKLLATFLEQENTYVPPTSNYYGIEELGKIVDLAFKGGERQYIGVNGKIAFWSSNRYKNFSKNDIKLAIKHLICECYFTVGNSVFI